MDINFQISVIIPVYNASRFLEKAVGSALQFDDVKEVILIEDGSEDDSLIICKKLSHLHPRVKVFQHFDKGNHGAGASRNLGLKNSSLPFIAFLDADDYYLENRFTKDRNLFELLPEVDGIYNALGVHYYCEEAKKKFEDSYLSEITTVEKPVKPYELFPALIGLSKNVGYFSLDCLTIKKDVLNRMSYWFNPNLLLHQDTEFIIRLSYYSNLFPGEINRIVAKRGVHQKNRIINNYSNARNTNINQKKLWDSLYCWAKNEKIPIEYLNHIKRMKISREALIKPKFNALFYFYKHVFFDTNIFIKAIYYNPFHFYFFGKNKISTLILKLKNKIQKICGINYLT